MHLMHLEETPNGNQLIMAQYPGTLVKILYKSIDQWSENDLNLDKEQNNKTCPHGIALEALQPGRGGWFLIEIQKQNLECVQELHKKRKLFRSGQFSCISLPFGGLFTWFGIPAKHFNVMKFFWLPERLWEWWYLHANYSKITSVMAAFLSS